MPVMSVCRKADASRQSRLLPKGVSGRRNAGNSFHASLFLRHIRLRGVVSNRSSHFIINEMKDKRK